MDCEDTRKGAQALPSGQCRKQNPPKQNKWGQGQRREKSGKDLGEEGAIWNDDGKMGLGWRKETDMVLLVRNYEGVICQLWRQQPPVVHSCFQEVVRNRIRAWVCWIMNKQIWRPCAEQLGALKGLWGELGRDTINLMSKQIVNICKSP